MAIDNGAGAACLCVAFGPRCGESPAGCYALAWALPLPAPPAALSPRHTTAFATLDSRHINARLDGPLTQVIVTFS